MPRYFFDLYDDMVALDEEGSILPGAEEARERALDEAREMITASVEEHRKVDLTHRMDIRDEAGKIREEISSKGRSISYGTASPYRVSARTARPS